MTTIYQSRYQGEEERDWRETTPEYIMEEVALGAVPGFEQGLKRDPAIRARQTAALEILDSTGYLLGKRMEFRVFPPPPTPPIEPTPDNPVTFILRVHSERVSSQYDRDHQEEGAWEALPDDEKARLTVAAQDALEGSEVLADIIDDIIAHAI